MKELRGIQSHFGEDSLHGQDIEAFDLCKIYATDAIQMASQVKGRCISSQPFLCVCAPLIAGGSLSHRCDH